MMTPSPDIRAVATAYTRMQKEYAYDDSIFSQDTPQVARLKKIIGELDTADRAIITLYADTQSLRKMSAMLGVSRGTIHKEITRIRKQILQRYECTD